MKRLLLTALLALALPAFAHRPGPWRAPTPPVMRAARWHRPPPPPFRPRFEPAVAGVLGTVAWALAPRPVWIPGHFETRTVLVNGVLTTQQVWVPGYYVWR